MAIDLFGGELPAQRPRNADIPSRPSIQVIIQPITSNHGDLTRKLFPMYGRLAGALTENHF